ncbi:MAG: histidinol-phosphate transaminase [Candidatus Omnitrophota bacterium]
MFIKEKIKKLKVYEPGRPIEELQRSFNLSSVYKLASNEIPFYPSYVNKAVSSELKKINRYPESGCYYLRRALSRKLRLDGENIVFGNGSDELIVMALRAFSEPSTNVVVGYPTFLIYETQAQVSGLEVKRVPIRKYRYDLPAMAKAADKNTRIVFIANPDNPHGTYCSHKEVEAFLNTIPKDIVVFFDEAYFEFVSKKDFPRSTEFLKKRKNIIITRTFSKAYGLAGLRIGYAITSRQIAVVLNKVREPFNVSRIAQVAAIEAVKNHAFCKKVIRHNNKEKLFLYQGLKTLGLDYVESVTNFILVNFKEDVSCLYNYLLRKGIIIRNMSSWGLKNFFRVSVGLRKENIAFIKKLSEYLKVKGKAKKQQIDSNGRGIRGLKSGVKK